MKTFSNIILVIIAGLLLWLILKPQDEAKPIVVTVPAVEGSGGVKVIESVKTVPVVTQGGQTIVVDERYKDLYENATDSIERLNLYLNAIKITERTDTVINDTNLMVIGQTKTRGDLLEYKFDYKIKERTIEIEQPKDRFKLSFGASAGVPTTGGRFVLRGDVGLGALNVGYDTEQRVWVGLRKDIK